MTAVNETKDGFRPLIVVGAARSGTKMLRDIIALHSDVDKVPYDVNYIWRLGNEKVPHDELSPEQATPEVVMRVRKQLQHYNTTGAPLLIEKTVGNSLRPEFVDQIFPDALYLHLVRDGRDVVESVYRQWLAPPDWRYIGKKAISFPLAQAFGYAVSYATTTMRKLVLPSNQLAGTWGPRYKGIDEDVATKGLLEVCAIQWRRSVERSLDGLAGIERGRVLTIRYEEFVQNPRQHLVQIAEFIDIGSSPYQDIDIGHISQTNIGKGFRNLTDVQIKMVMSVIFEPLQRLAYL